MLPSPPLASPRLPSTSPRLPSASLRAVCSYMCAIVGAVFALWRLWKRVPSLFLSFFLRLPPPHSLLKLQGHMYDRGREREGERGYCSAWRASASLLLQLLTEKKTTLHQQHVAAWDLSPYDFLTTAAWLIWLFATYLLTYCSTCNYSFVKQPGFIHGSAFLVCIPEITCQSNEALRTSQLFGEFSFSPRSYSGYRSYLVPRF